jgi:hypothetical protein
VRYWFKPKPDITVAELAEILQAAFMSLSPECWAKLTVEAQRHFEKGV